MEDMTHEIVFKILKEASYEDTAPAKAASGSSKEERVNIEKTVQELLLKILENVSEAHADPAKVAIAPEVAKILLEYVM